MTALSRKVLFTFTFASLLASGCAATSTDSRPDMREASFSNFLVIGVAVDYNARAQFERATVSELRRKGASASTYHSVVAGNKPITPDNIRTAVQSGNFDAMLVTRVLATQTDAKVQKDREEIDATPIGGRLVNLFRYDYTDYKNPGSIDLKTDVALATELYSAATEEIVWSMESSSKGETNLGLLIDETAATIVNRLDRDNLIGK
ncbi:MAG: hypothetical protein OES10_12540 [Gammaproteobacteria bacterium]|nr:hypothetical protein [Gammaproteobacteria bacterium]MDH3749628.1 hypothetical protein [Gammaproteobacteria bacterium]